MLGSEVPDLSEVPCPACGALVSPDEVVWDPYCTGDIRLAALPYHPACAGGILPPDEPTEAMGACGICRQPLTPEVARDAFVALHRRFTAPTSTATPYVVWRLASREPRVFVPEHLACILGSVGPANTGPPKTSEPEANGTSDAAPG